MNLVSNVREFKDQLKIVRKQTDLKFQFLLQSSMMLLLETVAKRTPVSPYEAECPGRLAGSWAISRDGVGAYMVPEGQESSWQEAVDRASNIMFSNCYAIWYLYNLVEYAEVVEYGLFPGSGPRTVDGYSTQAPSGMLRITMAEFQYMLASMIDSGAKSWDI